jgi:hypothetical protein
MNKRKNNSKNLKKKKQKDIMPIFKRLLTYNKGEHSTLALGSIVAILNGACFPIIAIFIGKFMGVMSIPPYLYMIGDDKKKKYFVTVDEYSTAGLLSNINIK